MRQAVFNALLVGIGGFVGSVLRFWLTSWVQAAVNQLWRPLGTLAVNVIGCFLIGLLMGLTDFRQMIKPDARLLLVVGLLGGFKTFSAFGYETFELVRNRAMGAALLNIGAQIVFGLAAVWAGYAVTRVG